MFKRIGILAIGAGLAAPLAAEFKSLWPMDGSLALVNGATPARSAEDNLKSSGGQAQFRLDPILGWGGSRWLILPSLALDWQSANSILKVQDERFEFLHQATSRLELGVAFRRTPDQRFGLKAFGEAFQARQAANEELQTGIYNYNDGGLGLDWRQKWPLGTPFRSTVGLTFTDRRYPNWKSLDPGERREKDQSIVRAHGDLEWAWTSVQAFTQLGVSLQQVAYREGVVIDSDGTTGSGKLRRDQVFDLRLAVPLRLGGQGIHVALGVQSWDSNLDIFDSQTGTFLPDYNDFHQARLDLGYSYDFKGPWGLLLSPQVGLDLGLELRQYLKRPARNQDGSLRDVAERGFVRDLGLGFNSALGDHWGLFLRFNSQSASSNNHDQTTALASYTFNTTVFGFNFVY